MALSQGDIAECKEIAREIVKEVLIEHIKCCPHGRVILASKWLLIGMCIASGLTGGGMVFTLVKLITNA